MAGCSGVSGFGRLLLRIGLRCRGRRCAGLRLLGLLGRRRLRARLGGARPGRDRRALANRLPVVVTDHHDDEFRFLRRNDLARHLRPFGIPPAVIADEPGIRAMLAHDADLGLLRKRFLEPMGQPVRISVAHDHHRDGGFGLLLRGCRRARIVDWTASRSRQV